MANVRIKNLPSDAAPNPNDVIPIDNGTTRNTTISKLVEVGRPVASQSEAEAGVVNNRAMTPLTVKQAIDAQVGPIVDDAINDLNLGTASQNDTGDFATAVQGGLADTAVQPGDLGAVATSNDYDDLDNLPSLDFAPSAQAVPVGGTTGQVLAKASDTNNDLVWTAAGAGDLIASNNLADVDDAALSRFNIGAQRNILLPLLDFESFASGDNWSPAIQQALDEAPQWSKISFDGILEIAAETPSEKTGWNGIIDLAGARIRNDFDRDLYPRGTLAAMLSFSGSRDVAATLGADLLRGQTDLTLASGSLSPGDEIAFTGGTGPYTGAVNVCVVRHDNGDGTYILDRPAIYDIASGGDVFVRTPVSVDVRGGATIDFNGTVDDPRWGYGVRILHGSRCKVRDISGQWIGSKLVELAACVDSEIYNPMSINGTDVAGDGGHSYNVRLSTGNDNKVFNPISSFMRHNIDFSASSRNKIYNGSDRFSYSAAYLTHGNGCRDNGLINCDVYRSQTAAFSFSASDQWNYVRGGKITDSLLIRGENDGTNTLSDIDYSSVMASAPAMFSSVDTSRHVISKSRFINRSNVSFIRTSGSGFNIQLELDDCEFDLGGVTNGLGSLGSTAHTWDIKLRNPKFKGTAANGVLMTVGGDVKVLLTNPEWTPSDGFGSNTALFSVLTGAVVHQNGGIIEFPAGAGTGYGYTLNGGTLVLTGGAVFKDIPSTLTRNLGASEIKIGDISRINTAVSLTNLSITDTFGKAPDLGFSTSSPAGTWSDGTRMSYASPAAGGALGIIRISGAWKTFGTVQS